jgi:hypothetical protein
MRAARIKFYEDPAQREKQRALHAAKSHGKVGTGAYVSWYAMKQRCTNPNNKSYAGYGARGVTICERWLSFENFHADMGDRPEGHTLDRIDNARGYEPENCRWATHREQRMNQRRMAVDASPQRYRPGQR